MYYHCERTRQLNEQFGDMQRRLQDMEASIACQLTARLAEFGLDIARAAEAAAELDCVLALAAAARDLNLCRPQVQPAGPAQGMHRWCLGRKGHTSWDCMLHACVGPCTGSPWDVGYGMLIQRRRRQCLHYTWCVPSNSGTLHAFRLCAKTFPLLNLLPCLPANNRHTAPCRPLHS